jgi:hypothetical protein
VIDKAEGTVYSGRDARRAFRDAVECAGEAGAELVWFLIGRSQFHRKSQILCNCENVMRGKLLIPLRRFTAAQFLRGF